MAVIHNLDWEGERTPAQVLDSIVPDRVDTLVTIGYDKERQVFLVATDYDVEMIITLMERVKLTLLLQRGDDED